MTPRDKRKYKGESVKYLASNFTFTPRLNDMTEKIAEENRKKFISNHNSNTKRETA